MDAARRLGFYAPSNGSNLLKTSSRTCLSVLVISFAFLSLKLSVLTMALATTLGLSKLLMATSVSPPRMLVLIGQQITIPVFLAYCFDDKMNVGRYFPISLPFVGSKSSHTISPLSGI